MAVIRKAHGSVRHTVPDGKGSTLPQRTAHTQGMAFSGIPAEAFDFYDALVADNSKSFFTAHKH
jgi:hypothetical protein